MKKKSQSQQSSAPQFHWEKLTWDDLLQWTDSRTLQRGRSYQRRGAVRNLNLLPDGRLLADVMGSLPYATSVSVVGNSRELSQRLESACSCPIGHRCKHGVAVILEYLDAIESGRVVEVADGDDRRLTQIEIGWVEVVSDDDDDFKSEDFDGTQEFEERDIGREARGHSRSRGKRSSSRQTRTKRQVTDANIAAYLSAKSQDELVGIIMQVCDNDAQFRQTFVDKLVLESGDHAAIIRETRKELRSVTSQEAWYDSWQGRGSLPDYSRLRTQLRALIDAEQFDAVLELGRELIERGMQQVEQSRDEGETSGEVMSAISIVAEAIDRSTLSDVDKILYVIDSYMQDDYDLCHAFAQVLDREYPQSAWADVAEQLKSRLQSQATGGNDREAAEFTRSYQRGRLSNWIIRALEASGDQATATNFCIEEARQGGSYQRAVDRLLGLRRDEEARELALEGLQHTNPTYAGLVSRLQDSLATIAARNNDHSVAASIAAARFIAGPSVPSLQDLLKIARKARCEPETKAVAMHFLETGKPPEFMEVPRTRSRNRKKAVSVDIPRWPFPTPPSTREVDPRLDRRHLQPPTPHFDVLIRLSIEQRDPESVLRWFDAWQVADSPNRYRSHRFDMEVADAVSATHPDRAIEMYCEEADRLAAQTNTSLYSQSVALLRKACKVLKSCHREHEFEVILATFHERHQRKRRLVELLNSLGGQPIVSKRSGKK